MHIKVKTFPSSNKNLVKKVKENVFHVFVKSPTKNNKANREVLDLLSGYLNIERKNIKIVSGHKKPSKILEIKD